MSNEGLTAYVSAFVDELTKLGVRHVVVSPGSRSTPLAMLLAEHPQMKIWMNMDERSAGFFALGIAKATKKTVALVCTSGTAAANYLPAVVEAKISRVPLLVITADRPHELRDVGAPQTIDQIDLFGKHAKWFVDMALPEEDDFMINYVRTAAGRAVATALTSPAGPVHLNFPFREPLLPDFSSELLWTGAREDNRPFVQVDIGERTLHSVANDVYDFPEKGIIVCGPMDGGENKNHIFSFAKAHGYPILADPLSQLRSGNIEEENLIECYDTFLKSESVKKELKPDVIIRFGAMPVSKALLLFIQKHKQVKQIVVDEGAGWQEPTLMASNMVYTSVKNFCEQHEIVESKEPKWLEKWKYLNELTKDSLKTDLMAEGFFEGKVITELLAALPDKSAIFTGNSMPVRDLDSFMFTTKKEIAVFGNRGANGIDGIVSSSLGVSTHVEPLVLVLGDLSFYHDLNGLLAAKLHQLNLTIVVINNNGGGIFSFLPQAKEEKNFETLFGTPINLNFKLVVEMYDGTYTLANTWDHFRLSVQESTKKGGLHIIEVKTERTSNQSQHQFIWGNALEKVEAFLEANTLGRKDE